MSESIGASEYSPMAQLTNGIHAQPHVPRGGPLLLYSTSPAPHELLALTLAAQRLDRSFATPIRVVVVQTPLEHPSPETLTPLWQHFSTQGFAIHMEDAGLATRADAYHEDVITRLHNADLVLITGGSPERAYRELYDTPALTALVAAREAGAVIAACSAGALLVGNGMLTNEFGDFRSLPLWNWLPHWLVAPHFGAYDIHLWQKSFPLCWVLGIPNDAMALVPFGLEYVESLGPEPLMIVPRGATMPTAVPAGQRWEIER